MRRRRGRETAGARGNELLRENRAFRRYVLRELERRGPLLSREIEAHTSMTREPHEWWGARKMGLMLELLAAHGLVAVVGRRNGQRSWDLGDRSYPETENLTWARAKRVLAERRRRALGVWLEHGRWRVHPEASDGPVPDRVTLLSPFDRLVRDRARAEALFGFRYRLEMYVRKAKREYGYCVLPVLRGDQLVGRLDPQLDRKSRRLLVHGVWAEPGEPFDEAMTLAATERLAAWLGAELVDWPGVRSA